MAIVFLLDSHRGLADESQVFGSIVDGLAVFDIVPLSCFTNRPMTSFVKYFSPSTSILTQIDVIFFILEGLMRGWLLLRNIDARAWVICSERGSPILNIMFLSFVTTFCIPARYLTHFGEICFDLVILMAGSLLLWFDAPGWPLTVLVSCAVVCLDSTINDCRRRPCREHRRDCGLAMSICCQAFLKGICHRQSCLNYCRGSRFVGSNHPIPRGTRVYSIVLYSFHILWLW